jgi:hypothetical protein
LIDRIWLIVVETPQMSPASAAPRHGALRSSSANIHAVLLWIYDDKLIRDVSLILGTRAPSALI